MVKFEDKYLNKCVRSCLEEGVDKFIVITQKGEKQCKEYNKVSKNDTIFYKIILTWKDKKLDYKLKKFEQPYKIAQRLKLKLDNERAVYLALYLVESKEYTFNKIDNKIRFKSLNDLTKYYNSYCFYCKSDREFYFGLI